MHVMEAWQPGAVQAHPEMKRDLHAPQVATTPGLAQMLVKHAQVYFKRLRGVPVPASVWRPPPGTGGSGLCQPISYPVFSSCEHAYSKLPPS